MHMGVAPKQKYFVYTYCILTYLLHGSESFLRSLPVFS